jgi:CHAD domain-containing protein
MDISGFAHKRATLLLDDLDFEVARTARRADPAKVHDLRVAIRRFVQCLRAFSDFFPAGRTKKIRRRLRALIDLAGAVRDRDIAMKLLRGFARGPATPLLQQISTQRKEARRALEKELRKLRRKEDCLKWKARLKTSPAGQEAADTVTPALPLLVRDYFWAGRDLHAAATFSSDAFHQFRLTGKRLRYTLELFRPCYGPELDGRLATLRKAQRLLGDANDCVAVKKLLDSGFRKLPGTPSLLKFLDQAALERWAEFRTFWQREADAEGEEERWIQLLKRFPGFVARSPRRPPSKLPGSAPGNRGPQPETKTVEAA